MKWSYVSPAFENKIILAYFPYFENIKVGLCYVRVVCVCEYRLPPIIFLKG
jgi:hypothetical protein